MYHLYSCNTRLLQGILRIDLDKAPASDSETDAPSISLLSIARQMRDRFFPALSYSAYASLWRANAGSMSAFSMQTVAQGWLVISVTGSPMMLGILGLFQAVPMVVLSPVGGLLADRLNRSRVIQVAQLMSLTGALSIGLLVALDRIEIWHLIVFAVIQGSSFAVTVPSRHAMVADLVPRNVVPNAVALNNATLSTANFIGPAVAGFLVGVFGIASAYFGQAVAYTWSIINVSGIGPSRASRLESGSILGSIRGGFDYVIREKFIRVLIILALSPALFGWPVVSLVPVLVKLELKGGPQDLGLLLGVLGVGSLIGATSSIVLSGRPDKGRVVIVSLVAYSGMMLALSQASSFIFAGIVLGIMGFCQAMYFSFNHSIIQLTTPSEIRGRVMSVWMITWGMTPIGLMPISAIAEQVNTSAAFAVAGSLSLVLVLCTVTLSRGILSLRSNVLPGQSNRAPR